MIIHGTNLSCNGRLVSLTGSSGYQFMTLDVIKRTLKEIETSNLQDSDQWKKGNDLFEALTVGQFKEILKEAIKLFNDQQQKAENTQ